MVVVPYLKLNSDDNVPCSWKEQTVTTPDIGTLTKISIQLETKFTTDNWWLYQINITDVQHNADYYFLPKHWLNAGDTVNMPSTLHRLFMAARCNSAGHYIFALCSLLFLRAGVQSTLDPCDEAFL